MTEHACNHVAVKCGLYHAALSAPLIAFADHNALAEQDAHAFDAYTLDVILMVVHEQAPYMIGVTEYVYMRLRHRRIHAKRITVLSERVTQLGQCFLGKRYIQRCAGPRRRQLGACG
jgi:hypothetical protein